MVRVPLRAGAAGLTGLVVGLAGIGWLPLAGLVVGGLLQVTSGGEHSLRDGIVDGSAAMLGRQLMLTAVGPRALAYPYALGYVPIPKRSF